METVLDIPVPPSVNRARRIDWARHGEVKSWQRRTDLLLMASGQVKGKKKIYGRYELQIIVDEKRSGCDLGNLEKLTTDYLVRIELVKDDGPKHLRKLTMEYGEAPEGIRVVLQELAE